MESTDKKSEGGCDKHGSCPRCKCRSDKKLNVYDWLTDMPESYIGAEFIEVQFKNTRKGYFKNSNKLELFKGDIVAVESSPGHDIGEVTLTGKLVTLQMKKNNIRLDNPDIRRVYRKAKPADIEKIEEAKAREHTTMLRARQIADELNLNMKIGDVEYQGDGNKAIFYYIADDRVDFRQLIKVLAEAFRVRIEMKQIGARQEAGRIGGIGPCGRELCCSGWMTSFISVATSAARFQDISLNPQKLAGQCAKLKCCLNYEVDSYVEAQKQLPAKEAVLVTKDGEFYHFKTDIHKRMMTYSTSRDFAANLVTIPASRVFEIIALNKRGVRVDSLEGENKPDAPKKDYLDVVGQDSLTRFDKSKKGGQGNNKRRDRDNRRDRNRDNDNNQQVENGQPNDNNQNNNDQKERRNNNKQRQDRNNGNQNRNGNNQPRQERRSDNRPPRNNEQRANNETRNNEGRNNEARNNEGRRQERNADQPQANGGEHKRKFKPHRQFDKNRQKDGNPNENKEKNQ